MGLNELEGTETNLFELQFISCSDSRPTNALLLKTVNLFFDKSSVLRFDNVANDPALR